MREIVFDTETTGLDPRGGDRVVEIGCVELLNHIPTGRKYHVYLNPERSMSFEAARVHGLDDAFLKDKPLFGAVVRELLDFVADAPLVAHNALFDLDFLNAELSRAGHPPLPADRMIDTLMLARRKHPAGPNSLDALLSRYQVDSTRRTVHGALLDAELLAEVYIELLGGRQATLILDEDTGAPGIAIATGADLLNERLEPRFFRVTEAELDAHRVRVATMGPAAIWLAYLEGPPVERAAAN